MLITSEQAAEILGCKAGTINALVRRKQLRNVISPKPGSTKCRHRFEEAEVRAFAREYHRPLRAAQAPFLKGREPMPVAPVGGAISEVRQNVVGILERLERIKSKIDRLVTAWGA
jgi:hypothetical protein